jgi:hypothetical protein
MINTTNKTWKTDMARNANLAPANSTNTPKSVLVAAFPHLSLLLLVLVYINLGACILNEVELASKPPPSSSTPRHKSTAMSSQLLQRVNEEFSSDKSIENRFDELLTEVNLNINSDHRVVDKHAFRYMTRQLNNEPSSKKRTKKKIKLTVEDVVKLASVYITDYKIELNRNLSKAISKFITESKEIHATAVKRVLDDVNLALVKEESATKPTGFYSMLFFVIAQLSCIGQYIYFI